MKSKMSADGVDRIDDVISAIGCGWWQFPMIVASFIVNIFPIKFITSTLLNAPVPFRCSALGHVDADEYHLSDWRPNGSFQGVTLDQLPTYTSTCLSPDHLVVLKMPEPNSSFNLIDIQKQWTGLTSCPVIEYDMSVFHSTATSEFSLVCENDYLRPLFHIMVTVGAILGCPVAGHIGDSLGRKRACMLGLLLALPASLAIAFTPWYPVVLVLRAILGLGSRLSMIPACNLALETIPIKYRTLVGMWMGLPFSIGIMAFAGSGYMVRNWRYLQLIVTIPYLVLVPICLCIDESPRWLVQMGRGEEAVKILEKAAHTNKVQLSPSFINLLAKIKLQNQSNQSSRGNLCNKNKNSNNNNKNNDTDKSQSTESLKKCLRSPAMLIILVVTPILWVMQALIYYGITHNVNNFTSTNPFLYLAIQGVVEVVAIVVSTPLTQKIGRKLTIGCGYILGAFLLMAEMPVPEDVEWLRWILVMSAFFFSGAAFQANFMYSAELFPTTARTRGFSFVIMTGTLGTTMAPIVTDLLIKEAWWATSLTLGLAGIMAGSLVFFLPETNNLPLPEDVEDVEQRRLYNKGLSACSIGLKAGKPPTVTKDPELQMKEDRPGITGLE